MELALKIANKIRSKERFCVYIVIPMWPEGDPKSTTMQEILYWQVICFSWNIIICILDFINVISSNIDYVIRCAQWAANIKGCFEITEMAAVWVSEYLNCIGYHVD